MAYELEEGQIVLCTVEKIMGTTVFVKIQDDGEQSYFGKDNKDSKRRLGVEGTITTSEISPGRIRNLRTYVVPGKKIVCKILSIKNGVHLSLRRVKQNEKKELLNKIKKEKNCKAILKTVLGKEESEKIIKKITQEQDLLSFFEQVKQTPKTLEKHLKKADAKKIIKIIESKKEKPKQIKQILKLSSKDSDGINKVKKIINNACKNSKCDISYLAAGKYSLEITGEDFKKIKSEFNKVLKDIEKQAKKQNCEFEIVKK